MNPHARRIVPTPVLRAQAKVGIKYDIGAGALGVPDLRRLVSCVSNKRQPNGVSVFNNSVFNNSVFNNIVAADVQNRYGEHANCEDEQKSDSKLAF